jgi:S-methylmethionine-dependent homocysteine/selenocysteine methylase
MSTIDQLNARLAAGEVVIIDGGMGTELQARGVPMDQDAWCGLANLDNKDLVRQIHEDYIDAGAEVIITNTYPTNRFALGAGGYGDRVAEANRAAVEAALQARENVAEHPVVVAGSMSVWGIHDAREKGLIGSGDADLLEGYREQASLLADAGVELIILEMMSPSWLPGLQAAAETGLPVWLGPMVGLDAEGGVVIRTGQGEQRDFGEALQEMLDPSVTAVTVMHSEIEPCTAALEVVAERWHGPFGAYPHVGEFERPKWVFGDVGPEDFSTSVMNWVYDLGAQLVGGCCGIRPDHIRALRHRRGTMKVTPRWPLPVSG